MTAEDQNSGVTTTEEELAALRGLGGKKKEEWAAGAAETEKIEKHAIDAAAEIGAAGRVKANKDRLLAGGGADDEAEEEEEEGERDPNIVRGTKKGAKEELKLEGVGDIKNKWKTGGVETAETHEAAAKAELEALKAGGVNVKARFQERTEEEAKDVKKWDRSELDTSAAAEARKSFIDGKAYESAVEGGAKAELGELQFGKLGDFKTRFEAAGNAETHEELEKQAIEVAIDLGNLKAAFLKKDDDMSPEERAALKKKEIEAEFIRYKLARKAAVKRAEEAGEQPTVSTAGVGDVKAAFDGGDAFKSGAVEKGALDVDFKIAGKAREKFAAIDAAGATPVLPGQNKKAAEPSKWDKKDTSTAEVINRRTDDREETPEDEDAFDVKNLMNKFKKIGQDDGGKVENSEARAELEALKTAAKEVKSRFEHAGDAGDSTAADEEKRRAMQEEFDRLRKEREEAKRALEEELAAEDANRGDEKEEIGVAAAHATKMTAKWEKIHAKEAKKAEKGRMPEKKAGGAAARRFSSATAAEQPRCPVCAQRVYTAEMTHCFGAPYHTRCFRCVTCRQPLRLVTARSNGASLFCQLHHSAQTASNAAPGGLSRCHA